MFTATLLCDPAKPCLDAALPQSLRNAWGGGDVVWLNPDVACEFSLAQRPENLWQVWEDVQAMGIDLIIQSSMNRRKKMLIADMDSTMIQQECIDELADVAGVGDHVRDITARAMNGELDFHSALRERVSLLKDLPETVIADVIKTRITLMPGGPVLLTTMKKNGAFAALVSGGFTAFTSHIAATLGFDENRANTLLVKDGKLTGEVADPILGQQAKVDALEQFTAQLGLSDDDAIAVGDGANDLGMLHRAGTGVALHAKPSVAAQCDVRVNHGDLTALLYIQGYMISDFAT
jgi:phosphoserine phosphatase